MMGWDRISEWIATGLVAALTWTSGLGALEPVLSAPADESGQHGMLGWAQSTDQPPVEQVGEGDASDPETLDQGAPPAQPTGDAATQNGDDVELLDQGPPPSSASAPAPAPAATAPTSTQAAPAPAETTSTADATAPAQAMGPALPPGFGSDNVHVSAGRSGFPIGLEECHVGVVTGRAYVGLDCGELDDVVGHAPSYDDFPFIPEVDFPFEGDEAFFTNPDFPFDADDASESDSGFFRSGRGDRDDDTRLVVAAENGAIGAPADERERQGGVTTRNGSVELAQRTRDRDPRVRVNDGAKRGKKDGKKDKKGQSNNVSSASNDAGNSRSADRSDRKKDRGKDKSKSRSKSQKSDKDKNKNKNKAKAKGEKKHQKAKGENGKRHRDKREKRQSSKKD